MSGLFFVFFLSLMAAQNSFGEEVDDINSIPGDSPAPTLLVSQVMVSIEPPCNEKERLEAMARELIFLHQGEPFSLAKWQQSVKALTLSNQFKQVVTEKRKEGERIALLFTLKPYGRIKDIFIQGKHPLFEREILQGMTIYPGDTFAAHDLPEQKTLIEALYRRHGYISPMVAATAHRAHTSNDLDRLIKISIEKGPYFILKSLDFSGNEGFSSSRLRPKMKVWRRSFWPGSGGRFHERTFKKDLQKLNKFYWKKGYYDCVIEPLIEKDPVKKEVSVHLKINEGSLYKDVSVAGNERFYTYTLKKKAIILSKVGNRSNLGIRKSNKNIKKRYHAAGYLDARVTVEDKAVTEDGRLVRKICFEIEEGPCTVAAAIRIRGNEAFDEKRIRKQLFTRLPGWFRKGVFIPEILEEDRAAIKTLYLKEGYLDAEIKAQVAFNEKRDEIVIDFDIKEGVPATVSSVQVSGVHPLSESDLWKVIRLKKGSPFRKYMVKSDENALAAFISEKGYPHVKVKGETAISDDRLRADIAYTIDEGPFVKMGEIYYTGNFRTTERTLQNELGIKPGEPFSLKRMFEGQRNIRSLDIFHSVTFKTIGLKEKADKVVLFVEIEEKKPFFVEFGGGFETQKGSFSKLKLGDHNLFGTNKDTWIGGEVSQIGHWGDLGISEPRLFGSHIMAVGSLYGEKKAEFNQDFGTVVYGASLGFSRKWGRHLRADLSISLEKRNQYSRAVITLPDEEFESRSIVVTTPSVRYDGRDSTIYPKKGIFSALSIDISQGLKNSLDDFFKYRLDLRYYWTPLNRLTLAWLGRVGYLEPFQAGNDSSKIPDDQLFYLGGTLNVRGFKENMLLFNINGDPVGGRLSLLGSMEARIVLGFNFELVGFFDAGKVAEPFEAYSDNFQGMASTFIDAGTAALPVKTVVSEDFRYSAGLGLRYITPIGPVGILYGFKLNRLKGESLGRFHFSIGYTF